MVAVVLTLVASVLCLVSLAKVRVILPEYPMMWAVGPYMPLAPAQFFHGIGVVGLIVLLIVVAVARRFTSRSGSPGLRRAGSTLLVLHYAILALAIVSHGWEYYRAGKVARMLGLWGRPPLPRDVR